MLMLTCFGIFFKIIGSIGSTHHRKWLIKSEMVRSDRSKIC